MIQIIHSTTIKLTPQNIKAYPPSKFIIQNQVNW